MTGKKRESSSIRRLDSECIMEEQGVSKKARQEGELHKLDKDDSPRRSCSRTLVRHVRYQSRCYNGPVVFFESIASSKLNEMIMALTQPHMSIVGIYGSSNTGNGEVVKEIERRVERDRLFDVVLKTTVVNKNTRLRRSKSPDVRRIQGELANQLQLQLDDKTSLEERASRLCETIKTKDKILIFLHHLQCPVDLGHIGIPFGNYHTGSKIVLVAQTPEVLSNQMNPPQIEFSVDD